jgi:hypothetical protein
MSHDLSDQLTMVATALEEAVPAVTIEDLGVMPARRRSRSRWTFMAASAAVVAVGLGTVAAAGYRSGGETTAGPISTVPLPGDVPPTGIHLSPEDQLALSMANDVLTADCMADAGFEFVAPTEDELIVLNGWWNPHVVLGIQREGAARRVGYHSIEVGGFGTGSQAARYDAMEQAERDGYLAALTPDEDAPAVEIELPGGETGGLSYQPGGCGNVPRSVFLETDGHQLWVDVAAGESWETINEAAIADERVSDALAQWRTCVEEATGLEADTPDELARRYAFVERLVDGQAVTDVVELASEIDVAMADVRCQGEAELPEVWYTVHTEVTRAQLGADVEHYDELARRQQANVATARRILGNHGVVPPSLG